MSFFVLAESVKAVPPSWQFPRSLISHLSVTLSVKNNLVTTVVGKNNIPSAVHTLILRTCEYVTLPLKRDFADVIQVKNVERGDYLV